MELKTTYSQAHDMVRATLAREQAALAQTQSLTQTLREDRSALDARVRQQLSLGDQVEAVATRKEQITLEVQETEHDVTELNFILNETKRRAAQMRTNVEGVRQDNQALVEPEIERLQSLMTDAREEMQAVETAAEKVHGDNDAVATDMGAVQAEHSAIKEQLGALRQEWSRVVDDPGRISKQISSVRTAITEVGAEVSKLLSRIGEANKASMAAMARREECDRLRRELDSGMEAHRADVEDRERDVAELAKSIQQEKAETHDLKTRRIALEAELVAARNDLKNARATHASTSAAYDRAKKELRRRVDAANSQRSLVPNAEGEIGTSQQDLKAFRDEAADVAKSRLDTKKEVDVFVHQVLLAEHGELGIVEQLKSTLEQEAALEAERDQWRTEEALCKKLMSSLQAQRDVKSRELGRMTDEEKGTAEESQMKSLQLTDLTKQAKEVNGKLRQFSKLYDVVKNERNTYVSAIQASAQALAEMKERIKILHNEAEILQNESIEKDKALAKERLAHARAAEERNQKQFDRNKCKAMYSERQKDVQQQILKIDRLNSVIDKLEKQMLELKSQYEGAVEARNLTGIQLIDRNDELCVLYEKSNIHETTLSRGTQALSAVEQDLGELDVKQRDVMREIAVVKRKFPKLPDVAETLLTLQAQLKQEKELAERLCVELENPSLSKRWQPLKGIDDDADRLEEKIGVLEKRLNRKREELLEKELVLEELGTLATRLEGRVKGGRDGDAGAGAITANELNARLKALTRKTMATMSELSMYQATSMKLEREKAELVAQLQEATARAEEGEVPSQSALEEWGRTQRRLQQDADRQAAAAATAAAGEAPIAAVRTTAEPRPNAYIPDEIGIPKPYGRNAPLKPTAPGAGMRHFRKPAPQPVDI